ncbi:hypothetical protein OG724_27550 [[Kitasatospora] papulosa]|uniref:hypothetical protein n=1 Tax=[Kitasatospora] papulosa TaxID=1464011 RepID=UPI002E2F87A8|nr:hypothetical protein [[Kitasatospora] papulosa]
MRHRAGRLRARRGSFVFGGDANVEYANINDPQNIPMATAPDMSVYIRFDNRGGSDAWCVERVEVRADGASGAAPLFVSSALDGHATLWLGREADYHIYLSM